MKTLYVVSDSHGYRDAFQTLLGVTPDADLYAHLGDYTSDAEALAALSRKPVKIVRGNGDVGAPYPIEELVYLQGQKVLLLHGHTCGVKYSLDRALYRAMELDASCVCYGHTHVPRIDFERGIFLVCPGAFSPRSASYGKAHRPSYARIQVKNGAIAPDMLIL